MSRDNVIMSRLLIVVSLLLLCCSSNRPHNLSASPGPYSNSLSGTLSVLDRMISLRKFFLDNALELSVVPSHYCLVVVSWHCVIIEEVGLTTNEFTGPYSCPEFIDTCLLSCSDVNDGSCRSIP